MRAFAFLAFALTAMSPSGAAPRPSTGASPLPIPPALQSSLGALARVRPDVRVGEWVTYRLEGGPRREAFIRLAVVAEDADAAGRPAYWLELDVGPHASMRAPLAQLRVLVTRSIGFRPEGISRMFIALAHSPPHELPQTGLAKLFSSTRQGPILPVPGVDEQVTLRGGQSRKLMTYAGTLEATPVELVHHARIVQRVWVSPTVPVLQLARIDGPDTSAKVGAPSGYGLQVFEYGLDAIPQMRLPDGKEGRLELQPKGTP